MSYENLLICFSKQGFENLWLNVTHASFFISMLGTLSQIKALKDKFGYKYCFLVESRFNTKSPIYSKCLYEKFLSRNEMYVKVVSINFLWLNLWWSIPSTLLRTYNHFTIVNSWVTFNCLLFLDFSIVSIYVIWWSFSFSASYNTLNFSCNY